MFPLWKYEHIIEAVYLMQQQEITGTRQSKMSNIQLSVWCHRVGTNSIKLVLSVTGDLKPILLPSALHSSHGFINTFMPTFWSAYPV